MQPVDYDGERDLESLSQFIEVGLHVCVHIETVATLIGVRRATLLAARSRVTMSSRRTPLSCAFLYLCAQHSRHTRIHQNHFTRIACLLCDDWHVPALTPLLPQRRTMSSVAALRAQYIAQLSARIFTNVIHPPGVR